MFRIQWKFVRVVKFLLVLFLLSLVSLKIFRGNNHGVDQEEDDDGGWEGFYKMAATMQAQEKVVTFTLVNDAFVIITLNWLCNAESLGILDSIVLVATDTRAYDKLRFHWPKLNIVLYKLDGELMAEQKFNRVGYEKFMIKRTELINSALQSDFTLLLFETDALWLKNPLLELPRHISNVDIVASWDKEGKVAGNFLYLKPTKRTKVFWEEKTKRMREQVEELQRQDNDQMTRDIDQELLSELINVGYSNIKVLMLPPNVIQSGQWYKSEEVRAKTTSTALMIINNNFVTGVTKKLARLERFGQYFLNGDGFTCNRGAVLDVLDHGPLVNARPHLKIQNKVT